MNPKIKEQFQLIINKGFVITDQEKLLGYLEKVGYHRLTPYFKNEPKDIERVISYYIFDKRLRLLCLDMLEVIENTLKSLIINYIGTRFNKDNWYLDFDLYNEKFVTERLGFIGNKIEERKEKDNTIKKYFEHNKGTNILPDYIFFDKLTFGELVKIYRDLKNEYKKIIADYFGINGFIFEDWIFALKYFRNLCSHYENIFNKTMTISIRSKIIKENIGNQNTFIGYFGILSLFNKILIPTFDWQKKVIELLTKFKITSEQIGLQTKNLPSELESEAWEVLVNSLYTKNVQNQTLKQV